MNKLFNFILVKQFEAIRDGDRLFYLSDDLGLYAGGTLLQSIKDIIDLDTVTLSQVIKNNTSITNIQVTSTTTGSSMQPITSCGV